MGSHISTRDYYDSDLTADDFVDMDRQQRRRNSQERDRTRRLKPHRPPRSLEDQAFRCRKCRQVIGAPVSGGRHRNHCPNCLHSLHVDLKRPGDRRSTCRSLMAPRGILMRRNGEQLILHDCLGCGKTQPTRVAADDNPVLIMRIPPIGVDDRAGESILLAEEIA